MCSASPNQWHSVSSPQYHASAAIYVITLLQQLADLCCVSHFAADCTTFILHYGLVLLMRNIHLIFLCESQFFFDWWSFFLQSRQILLLLLLLLLLNLWSTVLLERLTGSAGSQENLCSLWNTKVHHRIHKCLPSVPILSQLHPVSPSHLPRIHLNIRIASKSGSPLFTLSLRFTNYNYYYYY